MPGEPDIGGERSGQASEGLGKLLSPRGELPGPQECVPGVRGIGLMLHGPAEHRQALIEAADRDQGQAAGHGRGEVGGMGSHSGLELLDDRPGVGRVDVEPGQAEEQLQPLGRDRARVRRAEAPGPRASASRPWSPSRSSSRRPASSTAGRVSGPRSSTPRPGRIVPGP